MSTLTVKELAAPTGFDLKIAAGETLDLKSQGTVTMPAGAILQVVQGTVATEASTNSNSYQTIVSASITPSSSSSKIYITAGTSAYFTTTAGSRNEWTIFRDSTNVATGTSSTSTLRTGTRNNAGDANKASVNVAWLDSPSSTSAITYAFKARNNDAGAGTFYWSNDNSVSEIILMEVAG